MSFGLIGTFGSSPLCASRQAVKSCHSGAPPSVVMTVRTLRQLRLDVADLGDEFGPDEQHRRLAIVDDEGDLGAGEAPVHRRHHHIGLHRAHQQLEIEVAVLAEIGDALARLDAERDQRVGDAVGLDVEFGESWSGVPRIHRPAHCRGSWRGRAPCRQGSPVAAKRTCFSRGVLFSLRGVWRHPATKTIRDCGRNVSAVVPANAGTHTPRPIGETMGLVAFATNNGGYGFLLSQDDSRAHPLAARSFSFCALIESRALFQSSSLQSRS